MRAISGGPHSFGFGARENMKQALFLVGGFGFGIGGVGRKDGRVKGVHLFTQ